jgi:hypothetical protein
MNSNAHSLNSSRDGNAKEGKMQKQEENEQLENGQVGGGYWFKWVGVSVVFFAILGAGFGYLLADERSSWVPHPIGEIIFGGIGVVVGAVLGAITGAIRLWLL